jgi:hypothetical protein
MLWLLILWLLEIYMVVNLKIHRINRDTRKLIRTFILIKKKTRREAMNEYRKIVYVNAKLYVAHTMRASTAFLCSFCDHGASTRK